MPAEPAHPAGDPDHLLTRAAEAVALEARSPLDRFVLRTTAWFAEHSTVRTIVAVTALSLALAPGFVLLFFPDITDSLKGFSYFGVFLTNLASTATVFIPVPGLTGAAQLLIINQGDDSGYPWLVGIAGGGGMAVGEITAYYAGILGAELARGRELPGPKRLRGLIGRVVRGIDWLMDRWGMATLFVLAAVPNPAFEVAGITAGSVRMPFRRFFASVTAGKLVRGILLAYLGTRLPFV
ncbi:MAG: VTT domain-containing protein [Dehalococcoidia bacterium]